MSCTISGSSYGAADVKKSSDGKELAGEDAIPTFKTLKTRFVGRREHSFLRPSERSIPVSGEFNQRFVDKKVAGTFIGGQKGVDKKVAGTFIGVHLS